MPNTVELMHAPARKARRQAGFTLPEITIGVAVGLIIAATAMTFILISSRQLQNQEDRVSTTDDARNALQSVIGELRDATAVTWIDGRTVDATVRTSAGGLESVRYQCVSGTPTGTCTRTNTATGASRELLTGLVNTDNFTLVTGSDVEVGGVPVDGPGGTVAVRLELDLEQDQNTIILSSAVSPRNCSDASPPAGVKVNIPCS